MIPGTPPETVLCTAPPVVPPGGFELVALAFVLAPAVLPLALAFCAFLPIPNSLALLESLPDPESDGEEGMNPRSLGLTFLFCTGGGDGAELAGEDVELVLVLVLEWVVVVGFDSRPNRRLPPIPGCRVSEDDEVEEV
jgi:hypothetical protein